MKKSVVDVDILAQKVPDIKPHQRSRQQEAPQQLSLFPSEPKLKPGGISLKSPCRCGGTLAKTGAGRKPGEESRRCLDCGEFLGYSPIERLRRLRKQNNLTDSLNFLESRGIVSQEAQIFLLNELGAIGGEA